MAVLMCRPDYYAVEYEINPWMHISNQVDRPRAAEQWQRLFHAYRGLGQTVELVEPQPGQPDMVFTANAGLVRQGRAVLSHFAHRERQGEEPYWRAAFQERGYEVTLVPEGLSFEGAGDALFVGDRLFAGYPLRTDREVHALISKALEVEVVSVELVDETFYHLDTCFCPLGPETVMFAPDAFAPESARVIRSTIPHVIEVPREVAMEFVCNGVALAHRLVSSTGVEAMDQALQSAGFSTMALPMSEFIKAGGGVRCLSLFLD